MKKMLVVPFLLALLSAAILAAIPQQINYQGQLKNSSGTPLTGTYSILFTVYDAASSETNLWSETQSVSCEAGLFNVLLGSVTPIPTTVFSGADRWLGVQVGSDAEMTPRQKLVSVGNAFQASNADNLGGHPASYFATSGGSSQWTTSGSNIYYNTGNVGIGTSDATDTLIVNGNVVVNDSTKGFSLTSGSSKTRRYGLKFGSAGNLGDSDLLMLTNREANGELAFATNSGTGGAAGEVERVRIKNNGSVGIGTTAPSATFEVGTNHTLVVNAGTGRIGVGTMSPNTKFDLEGTNLCFRNSSYSSTYSNYQGAPYYQTIKSHSDTLGTLSPTQNGEVLSELNFQGVDSNNVARSIAGIEVSQVGTGSPGDWQIPGQMIFLSGSPSGGVASLTLNGQNAFFAGKVGIGTTAPGYTFEVNGIINATTDIRKNGASIAQWTTNGSNIYYNSGNVGIGTTNPGAKLNISGNGWGSALRINNDVASSNWNFVAADGGDFGIRKTVSASDTVMTLQQSTGNVGIGTTSPSSQLNVAGVNSYIFDDNFSGDISSAAIVGRKARGTPASPSAVQANDGLTSLLGRGYGATGWGANNVGGFMIYASENFSDSAQGTYLTLGTTLNGTNTRSERMRIDNSGNVGIGTTAPGYTLEVNGIIHSAGSNNGFLAGNYSKFIQDASNNTVLYNMDGGGGAFWFAMYIGGQFRGMLLGNSLSTLNAGNGAHNLGFDLSDGSIYFNALSSNADARISRPATSSLAFDTGGTERMRINASGNVGIGTTNPGQTLTLQRGDGDGNVVLSINNTSGTLQGVVGAVGTANDWAAPSAAGDLFIRAQQSLQLATSGSGVTRMTITSGGSVGIGTASPAATFEVGTNHTLVANAGSGNVGIGTTNPRYKLHVRPATDANLHVRAGSDWGGSTGVALQSANDADSGSLMMRIAANPLILDSNVGIGTTNPTRTLEVNGIIKATSFQGSGAALTGITNYTAAPSAISVPASGTAYQNATAYPASVIVSGGTVSLIEFSRDGSTFYDVGAISGMFTLSPNDYLRVTYSSSPTMTFVPR